MQFSKLSYELSAKIKFDETEPTSNYVKKRVQVNCRAFKRKGQVKKRMYDQWGLKSEDKGYKLISWLQKLVN